VPVLLQFLSLPLVSPIENVLGFLNNLLLYKSYYQKLLSKFLLFLLIGNFVGSLIGAYLLKNFASGWMLLVLGIFIIFWEGKFLIQSLFGKPKTETAGSKTQLKQENQESPESKLVEESRPSALPDSLKINSLSIVVGLISGTMSAVFAMGGPPLVIYLRQLVPDKDEMRALLLGFFTINGVMQIFSLSLNGLITWEVLGLAALCFPLLLLGTVLGNRIVSKIHTANYQRIVAILLIFAAIMLIFRA
jgi:uncharacterized membrane protein YfcA